MKGFQKADKRPVLAALSGRAWQTGVLALWVLEVPAVRTAPAGAQHFVDDGVLAFLEIGGIAEALDEFSAVGLDDAKLKSTSWHWKNLALQELSLALEPPEHRLVSRLAIDAARYRARAAAGAGSR